MFDPALVLCLDGTGLGGDGSIWGGELVLIDAGSASWQRVGRLSPFLLPGGTRPLAILAYCQGFAKAVQSCGRFINSLH